MAKKHRFERTETRLTRRPGRKRPYERTLIVCEAERTEVNYFEAIRREKRLLNADIRIVSSDYGTSPFNIVKYAIDLFNETEAFDRLYLVFDRDDHPSYYNALAKAEATDKKLRSDEGAFASANRVGKWFLLNIPIVGKLRILKYNKIIFLMLCLAAPAMPSFGDDNLKIIGDGAANLSSECTKIPGLSQAYCNCIINMSNQISENDPILKLFIINSRNPTQARDEYNKLVTGNTYNNHNFSSIAAKKDFIEGQGRIFVHRIDSKCAYLN